MTNTFVLPPILLMGNWVQSQELSWFDTVNSAGDGLSIAWRWSLEVDLPITQKHNNPNTLTPGEYNGYDVKPGMWVSNRDSGIAVKIVSIKTENDPNHPDYPNDYITTANHLSCIVEDVDYFNTNISPSGRDGGVVNNPDIPLVIFEVMGNGVPVLTGLPPMVLNPTFQSDIQGRFVYRNKDKDYVSIYQPSHTFQIGDIVYLGLDGIYHKMTANRDNKDNIDRIIGTVHDIGIPEVEYFSIILRGELVDTSLIPSSLSVSVGQVVYVDKTTAGALTTTKPTVYQIPMYLKLADNKYMNFAGGGASSAGPLGYYATTYVKDTIADRNNIETADLQLGDVCYVTNNGVGEWSIFMWVGSGWTEVANQDSETSDAHTSVLTITKDSLSVNDIARVSFGRRISNVSVEVLTAFDGSPVLNIGDSIVNDRLLGNAYLDLSSIGTYISEPSYQYTDTNETWIEAYFSAGGATHGQARVTITYV